MIDQSYYGPGTPLHLAAARGAAKARTDANLTPLQLLVWACRSEHTELAQAAYIGAYLAASGALVRTDHQSQGAPFTEQGRQPRPSQPHPDGLVHDRG